MRSMSVNKPMNQELIFLSISVRIHFAKMLCQEKGEFGCQLSPLAENGKTLLTHGKEMKISTVIVSTPIQCSQNSAWDCQCKKTKTSDRGSLAAAMWLLYQWGEEGTKPEGKSINLPSVYVPAITYGHGLWAVTKGMCLECVLSMKCLDDRDRMSLDIDKVLESELVYPNKGAL